METLELDDPTMDTIKKIIAEAGREFPCLSCPSKEDCSTFKWFLKWFENNEL